MNLKGKVVIVTGGGTGLGASLVRKFHQEGAKVVLAGRREEKLKDVIRSCGTPVTMLAVPTDVTEFAQLERLIERTLAQFGRIDVIVNNAGIGFGGFAEDVTPEEIEYSTRVNLTAPMWLTWLGLRHLPRHDSALVYTVSLSGLVGMPAQSHYCASKYGLRGYVEALRRDLLATDIQTLAVYPGAMDTELNTPALRAEAKRKGVDIRALDPADVARKVLTALKAGKNEVICAATPDNLLPKLDQFARGVLDKKMRELTPAVRDFMVAANAWVRKRNVLKPAARNDESSKVRKSSA